MTRWVVLALVMGALGGCGCKGERPAERARETAAPASPSSPEPVTPPVGEGGGGYQLTREKLEAYVRYQNALVGIYDALLRDLEKLPASRPDAGRSGAAGASAAMRVLESKARAEEKARAEAGLSERDAREIDRIVMAVINKRTLGRSFDATSAIKQWEAMREKVPAERRTELDRSINELKAQQEEMTKLSEERREFGDANVDLILSREEELTQNYNAYVARLTGRR